jgi:hypothetical protein
VGLNQKSSRIVPYGSATHFSSNPRFSNDPAGIWQVTDVRSILPSHETRMQRDASVAPSAALHHGRPGKPVERVRSYMGVIPAKASKGIPRASLRTPQPCGLAAIPALFLEHGPSPRSSLALAFSAVPHRHSRLVGLVDCLLLGRVDVLVVGLEGVLSQPDTLCPTTDLRRNRGGNVCRPWTALDRPATARGPDRGRPSAPHHRELPQGRRTARQRLDWPPALQSREKRRSGGPVVWSIRACCRAPSSRLRRREGSIKPRSQHSNSAVRLLMQKIALVKMIIASPKDNTALVDNLR